MIAMYQNRCGAWNIGDTAYLSHTFTEQTLLSFVELTGDENPLHRVNAARENDQALVPGALLSGLAIGVVGSRLPGPGCILLTQTYTHHLPVYSGETISMFLEIVRKEDQQRQLTIEVICEGEQHEKVMSGTIVVKLRK